MTQFKKLVEKCKKQKSVVTSLVLEVIEVFQSELKCEREKYRDAMNEKNKDIQFLENRIRLINETNARLKDTVRKLNCP